MAKIVLSTDKIEKIKAICKSFHNEKGEVISVLHKVQDTFGYLPAEVQDVIAKELKLSLAHIYGIVTFYSFFTMTPKGEFPISICTGTACYVRGAEKILEEFKKQLNIGVGETTPDGKFSIDCLRCVGVCGLAPIIYIGQKAYGKLTPESVKDIIAEYL
ncbi:MAG: NADH-quinone oxidoreductase subunit NuoE [Bacteroidales bacterium]|nr:NADH-quinone oxidoreductase subunit NuoE [Bacteroidales bacterium]